MAKRFKSLKIMPAPLIHTREVRAKNNHIRDKAKICPGLQILRNILILIVIFLQRCTLHTLTQATWSLSLRHRIRITRSTSRVVVFWLNQMFLLWLVDFWEIKWPKCISGQEGNKPVRCCVSSIKNIKPVFVVSNPSKKKPVLGLPSIRQRKNWFFLCYIYQSYRDGVQSHQFGYRREGWIVYVTNSEN